MQTINAIILSNDILNYEILFKKVSEYIKISLKISNIQNIYEVQDLNDVTDEMLLCDDIIVIKDIAPEIVEYDKLISHFNESDAEISYFSVLEHDHSHDDDDNHSFTDIDIFILSKDNFVKGNFEKLKKDNILISDATVICDYIDITSLNEDFRYQINTSHLQNGVYILDPNNTYIASGITIGKGTTILPNTIIRGNTKIGENCTLGPNTVIENMQIGNSVKINSSQTYDSSIGDGTTVGPFAYIRPQSVIGQNVKIGDFVEIKKSTLGEGTKVSHLTYIGDATIGKHVNFGCGTVVVNYDGFNKYQTIVEDNAFIGCNTNLVSPVTVKKGAMTAAGSTITNDVPEDDLAISRVKQENKPLWAAKFRKIKSRK